MIDYKRIFKSQDTRKKILQGLAFIPDKQMVKLQYRIHNGIVLNLKKPHRYTEKLQWYKLYYRDPLMRKCVDKHEVRKYITSKGLENILIPEFGCYDNPDQINWELLPNSFVLKLTNGGGGLNCLFCHDKNQFDIVEANKTMKEWISGNSGISPGREWAYEGIRPRIVCEELLDPSEQNGTGLDDYKFFCFDGRTVLKWVDFDRYVKHKRVLFTAEGERIDAICTHESPKDFKYPKKAFDVMQPIVDKLSADFPHVRVDLYFMHNRVYFGELTFYSGGGYEPFQPDYFDYWLGSLWNLPNKRI